MNSSIHNQFHQDCRAPSSIGLTPERLEPTHSDMVESSFQTEFDRHCGEVYMSHQVDSGHHMEDFRGINSPHILSSHSLNPGCIASLRSSHRHILDVINSQKLSNHRWGQLDIFPVGKSASSNTGRRFDMAAEAGKISRYTRDHSDIQHQESMVFPALCCCFGTMLTSGL